jgi:ligand-binding sensor domain-containing protein/signal transduction histidine kinase
MEFKHLTPDDGLSSSTVTCFLQDHKGFMWIGTYYGLNRYDGYNFVVYTNDATDSTSLAHNIVWTIYEDSHNNIWIGTAGGLSVYNWEKDRFNNYLEYPYSSLSNLKHGVLSMVQDSLENFWFATDRGLLYHDQKNDKTIFYTQDSSDAKSLSYYNVEYVFIDSRNKLWISTRNGLNLFDPTTHSFHHMGETSSKNPLSDIYFTDIVEDKNGNLWFGTLGAGLFRLDVSEKNPNTLINFHYDPKDNRSLSSNRINSLYVDRLGGVWVGTENGGLNKFDPITEKFWCYRSRELDPKSLNNESIYAMNEDRQGNFWIGTFAGGINIAEKNSNAILRYGNLPGVPTSLNGNSVTSFVEDRRGKIWIGTDGGGLNVFDPKTDRFSHFTTDNSQLNSNVILSILQESDRYLWLGTWGGGLNLFDKESNSVQSFTTSNSHIRDNNIVTLSMGHNNDLWMGSFQHGVIHYSREDKTFINYTSKNSALSLSMVTVVQVAPDGRILIGTPSGFNIFDPNTTKFKVYYNDPKQKKSISSNGIHALAIDNDTSIYIGTNNGLNRFNPRTESFTHFFKEDGLPDNAIKSLVFDQDGQLWVGTNKGVCRFDPHTKRNKIFTKSDGLQSNEFNDKSAFRSVDGRIFLGGTKGFNIIFPARLTENTNIPAIVLTNFLIFNTPVEIGTMHSPLKKHISETSEIELSYTQSVFTFHFAAMDFTVPEKNQYTYKMEGFEKNWNFVGKQRMATYTNLGAGEYTFRVLGSNNDGYWNEKGTSVKIIINPPFWETLWFRGILIVILVAGIILGFYLRTSRIRSQNQKLQQHVRERTVQLEAANKELEAFAYSVSHDLRAPLRAIGSFTHILSEDYEKYLDAEGKRICSVITSETLRMGRLIDALLTISRISHAELNKITIDMESLARTTFEELIPPDQRSRIEIHIDNIPDTIGDPILIREVWMNLLSNAIKFSSKRERTSIDIGYQQDGQKITYFVRDNGVGFDPQYGQKLFGVFQRLHSEKEFEGTGVGLALVQRLIHRHGGSVWATSELNQGATFYFTIEGTRP